MEYLAGARGGSDTEFSGGLWPPIFNAAPKAILHANATCGLQSREKFCHMTDAHPLRRQNKTKCGACDAEHSHPIDSVIDRSGKWWQSPTLASGPEYEHVTITMDLKQVSDGMRIEFSCPDSD